MLFRPQNTLLVAASFYLGGLGAAAAPMNFGDKLSSTVTHFGRLASNTISDGAWASGEGLLHSQALYPTQMIHHDNFGMQRSNTQDALYQVPGGGNTYYGGNLLDPYAAQHHPSEYGNMHAYHFDTYGIPTYSQQFGLSIEPAPSLHQQQVEFGDPGIPSLGANQHDNFGTAFHGNVLDGHTGVPPFLASFPAGHSEATPPYPPHSYGYSQDFPFLDGVPVEDMSHMEIDGQKPAYQGMGHPPAAVPDEIDKGPVQPKAKTAGKKAGRPEKLSLPKPKKDWLQLGDQELRARVLDGLQKLMRKGFSPSEMERLRTHFARVQWFDGPESYNINKLRMIRNLVKKKLDGEIQERSRKQVARTWKELMAPQSSRFDMGNLRIVLSLTHEHTDSSDLYRVTACEKGSEVWYLLGKLQVPLQLKEGLERTVHIVDP